jgi:hypothetical protein
MVAAAAELIAYFLSPDRLPPGRQWSRKHAHTQARLCHRFVSPVLAGLACQDIKTAHMRAVVNAAPTAQEGHRLTALISALVGAGITGGYLASPRAWTWPSLRHVFCTTALFTWNIDPTDVSRLAGHANYRITLDLYIGATAGTLDRARTATA